MRVWCVGVGVNDQQRQNNVQVKCEGHWPSNQPDTKIGRSRQPSVRLAIIAY
jgi:hypothetical protein